MLPKQKQMFHDFYLFCAAIYVTNILPQSSTSLKIKRRNAFKTNLIKKV